MIFNKIIVNHRIFIAIILLAFVLRIIPLNYPILSADPKILERAYSLSTRGQDEQGRSFPIIFHYINDYQMPLTPYLLALSFKILGHNDFAAKLPFLLLGTLIVFLVMQISWVISPDRRVQ